MADRVLGCSPRSACPLDISAFKIRQQNALVREYSEVHNAEGNEAEFRVTCTESPQRQDPGGEEAGRTDGNPDGGSAKPVKQCENQIHAADQD